jgi:hypothetical protein
MQALQVHRHSAGGEVALVDVTPLIALPKRQGSAPQSVPRTQLSIVNTPQWRTTP